MNNGFLECDLCFGVWVALFEEFCRWGHRWACRNEYFYSILKAIKPVLVSNIHRQTGDLFLLSQQLKEEGEGI